MLAIREDRLTYLTKNCIERLPGIVSDNMQARVMNQPGVGDMQRVRETVLRHMINLRDIRQRHPRIHGTHVASEDMQMILLKLVVSPDGPGGGEKHTGQRQAQQETDTEQFHAQSHVSFLPSEQFLRRQ